MDINISLLYFTAPGEHPVLILIKPSVDTIAMTSADGYNWLACISNADIKPADEIEYRFEIVANEDGRTLRREYPEPHTAVIPKGVDTLTIDDRWHDVPPCRALLSSAFTKSIFRRPGCRQHITKLPDTPFTIFEVIAPQVEPGQTLTIVGDCPALGNWDPGLAPELSDCAYPLWSIAIPSQSLPQQIQYKFCIIDSTTRQPICWEEGDNRSYIAPANPAPGEATIVKGLIFEQANPSWHGTGTVIPVFSLRSADSFGIGDFHDLKLMVDWMAATNQNILQILPINDTTMTGTWSDSYPYNAVSVFALHPIYLKVEQLGTINDSAQALIFDTRKKALNSLHRIDYEHVFAAKMDYARAIFAQEGAKTLRSKAFKEFAAANAEWLEPYAAFSVLRDIHHTPDITKWGQYSTCRPDAIETLLKEHAGEANFYRYLQYHLHSQLTDATAYAHTKGVIIKGDIAIGISRNSVDAWQHPDLFNLGWCAGAPPDAFAKDGQNWGFPTYNWERMQRDDYAWWRARLRKMSEYFDAYRIDHLLGFFRIWQIPRSRRSGLLGIFSPSLPYTPQEMAHRWGFDFQTAMAEPGLTETDLLFINDPDTAHAFHPAIGGLDTPAFGNLTEEQQHAYRALHHHYFYERHNEMWEQEALKKLTSLLTETQMLACGEDLGMIPSCVKPVMDRLKILSLEVQRMPKTYGVEVDDPARYHYLSVATTSTHDMPGLRLWLEENVDTARRLLTSLNVHDATDVASPENCRAIVESHLRAPSMLCILPWQDWMSIHPTLRHHDPAEEVINIPAVSNHYWRYRMHLNIEDLLEATDLNEQIRTLIAQSQGR